MDALRNNSSSVNKSAGFRSENRNLEESSDFPIQNLKYIMYACGDVRHPLPKTVKLVYLYLREQMNLLLMEAQKAALIQNSDVICLEHILFLMRKNKVKLKRLLRYLQVLDLRSVSMNNLQAAEGGENTNPTLDCASGQNVRRCMQFLSQIEECGEFTSILQDKRIRDPTVAFRAQKKNLMSIKMTPEEYKEFSFIVPRATFCSAQRKGQFKDWLLQDNATQLDISYRALTVINCLAIDTVAQLIDMALIIKVQKTTGNAFIDQMYLTDLESTDINLYEEAMFYDAGSTRNLDGKADALSNCSMPSTPKRGTVSASEKSSSTSSFSGASSSSSSLTSSSKTSSQDDTSSGSLVGTADDSSGTSDSTGTDSLSTEDISDDSITSTKTESIHGRDKSQSVGKWSADVEEYRVIDDSASFETGPDGQSLNALPEDSSNGCLNDSQCPLDYSQKYPNFEDISGDENLPLDHDGSLRPSIHLGESRFSHHGSRENITRTSDSSSRLIGKTDAFAPQQSQAKVSESRGIFKDPKPLQISQGAVPRRRTSNVRHESARDVDPHQKLIPEAAAKTTEKTQSSVKSSAFYFAPDFKKPLDVDLINKGEEMTSNISFTDQIHCADRESSTVNLYEDVAGSTSDLAIVNREAAALSNDGVENTSRDGTGRAFEKKSCISSHSGNQESRSPYSFTGASSKTSSRSNFLSGDMAVIASGTSGSNETDSESMAYVAVSEPESDGSMKPENIQTEDKPLSLGERNDDTIVEHRIIDDSASNEGALDDPSASAYPERFSSGRLLSELYSSEATFQLNYEQKCPLFEDISSDEIPPPPSSVPSIHLGESVLSHHDSRENVSRTPDASILTDLSAPLLSQEKVPENQVFKAPEQGTMAHGRTTNLQRDSSMRNAAGKAAENSRSSVQVSNESSAFSLYFKEAFIHRTALTPLEIKEAHAKYQITRHPLKFFQNPNPFPQRMRILCLLEAFDCLV